MQSEQTRSFVMGPIRCSLGLASCLVVGATATAEQLSVPDEYATIQAAINAASNGDEIVVAPDTYNERINFLGKAIVVRSSSGCSTNTIIDGQGAGQPGDPIVTCSNAQGPQTLEGFTITTDGSSLGIGMLNEGSSPTVINCSFRENDAPVGDLGGGMWNRPWGLTPSNPIVVNCQFIANFAPGGGGGMMNSGGQAVLIGCHFESNSSNNGGGLQNSNNSSATLIDCTFADNTSTASLNAGGGMSNDNSNPLLINCTFSNNHALAGGIGGGIWTNGGSPSGGSPLLVNCVFAGNTARAGGGMYVGNASGAPSVVNCTFSQNVAQTGQFDKGGAIHNFGLDLIVTNCILWNDTPDEIALNSPTVSFSIVQGGFPGAGNDDSDPEFVEPSTGNFRISPGSPAENTGSNAAVPLDSADVDGDGNTTETIPIDRGGFPRILDGQVDKGAYEILLDPCTTQGVEVLVDCNDNMIQDSCDISSGASEDCNANGVPDECETDPSIDIIFLIDASGSIEAETWELQKEGISQCLVGPNASIPADGSASIAVIHFADVECNEVTLTAIDTPAEAQDLSNQILGLEKPDEGATMLIPALDRASEIFQNAGSGLFRQLFILTDGVVSDQEQVLLQCEDLRTQQSVKICTGLVGTDCMTDDDLLIECANVDHPSNPNFDPNQPVGSYRCVPVAVPPVPEEVAELCDECIVLEADCNANGTPDSCEPDDDGDGIPDDCECPWDCDGSNDNNANSSDLLALLAQYDVDAPNNCTGGSCDYNADGCVDVADLLQLLAHITPDPEGIGCPQ